MKKVLACLVIMAVLATGSFAVMNDQITFKANIPTVLEIATIAPTALISNTAVGERAYLTGLIISAPADTILEVQNGAGVRIMAPIHIAAKATVITGVMEPAILGTRCTTLSALTSIRVISNVGTSVNITALGLIK